MLRWFVVLLALSIPAVAQTASPRVDFCDLTVAPNVGNTDTSHGQTSGVDGAILSCWGQNIGASQGSSTITIGGAVATTIYYWGPAVCLPSYCASPANLGVPTGAVNRGAWNSATAYSAGDLVTNASESWYALQANTNVTPGSDYTQWLRVDPVHNMQIVIAQVPHTAATGAQIVYVTVNGTQSTTPIFNTTTNLVVEQSGVPITITSTGTMRYAGSGGSDSNSGTWSSPYKTLKKCKNSMVAGDICYALNGSDADGPNAASNDDCSGSGMSLAMTTDGTQSAPFQLVGYPGQEVQVGRGGGGSPSTGCPVFDPINSAKDPTAACSVGGVETCRYVNWWSMSKLNLYGSICTTCLFVPDGSRFVGNLMHSDAAGSLNQGFFNSFVGDIKLFGNEARNIYTPATGVSEYHVFYISGWRGSPNPGSRLSSSCGAGWSVSTPSNTGCLGTTDGNTTSQIQVSDADLGWNDCHDNGADTCFQVFNHQDNTTPNQPWSMTGHRIHDNYMVNQSGDGIKWGGSTVGDEFDWNNVCVNCGVANVNSANLTGIDRRGGDGVPAGDTTYHSWFDTIISAGTVVGGSNYGAMESFSSSAQAANNAFNVDQHNIIVNQTNGLGYWLLTSNTGVPPTYTTNPSVTSNNLYNGCTSSCSSPAAWESSSSFGVDPHLASSDGSDPAPTSSSAAVNGKGVAVGGVDYDIAGLTRPATPSIGAMEMPPSASTGGTGIQGIATLTGAVTIQ